MTLATGQQLGDYEILGPLGTGGMGEVYRARDSRLGREVALKLMRSDRQQHADSLARFQREACLLAALHHPHIAILFDLARADGVEFLVLEYVPGVTLAERLQRGPLPPDEACALGRQIAAALEAAHARGILHRDLKPSNIKVTADGQIKVLDFGLGKNFGEEADAARATVDQAATGEGVVLGTPPYMSPEQARGRALDVRTDVWAFGCVLYEMLTGRRAFAGATVNEVLAAVLEREPDWSALPPDTPAPVRDVLQRCLRKDPERRLRDIRDVRLEVEEGSIQLSRAPTPSAAPSVVAGPATTLSSAPSPSPPRRRRRGWLVAAALLAAATTGLVFWLNRPQESPAPKPADDDPIAALKQHFGVLKEFTSSSVNFFEHLANLGGKDPGKPDDIAVLPFATPLSWFEGKESADRLAGALADALRAGKVRVTSQSKVSAHGPFGQDAQAAGRALNSAHVLTGKIVVEGQTLHVRVELVETKTGTGRWGNTFTCTVHEVSRPAQLAGTIAAEARKGLGR